VQAFGSRTLGFAKTVTKRRTRMKIFNVVHGRKDAKDDSKTFWSKCGILLKKDDGKISLKLESLPVGEWDGWLSVFEQDKKEDKPAPSTGNDVPF
jgi:hypothetical protein